MLYISGVLKLKNMNIISTEDLHYNASSQTFSQEISMLSRSFNPHYPVTIKNPKTGVSKVFKFSYADKDSSNEDTYGWNYVNSETGLKLLIIND